MAQIIKCIDINVPVEVAFEYVSNPRNTLKYSPQFNKFESVGPKERGLGAMVEATGHFMGMDIKTKLEITEFIENVRFVSRSVGGVKSTSTWEFKPMPDGSTEVTFTSDYTMPGSFFGKLLDKVVMQKDIEKTTVESLVNLKKLLEGRPNLRVAAHAMR